MFFTNHFTKNSKTMYKFCRNLAKAFFVSLCVWERYLVLLWICLVIENLLETSIFTNNLTIFFESRTLHHIPFPLFSYICFALVRNVCLCIGNYTRYHRLNWMMYYQGMTYIFYISYFLPNPNLQKSLAIKIKLVWYQYSYF